MSSPAHASSSFTLLLFVLTLALAMPSTARAQVPIERKVVVGTGLSDPANAPVIRGGTNTLADDSNESRLVPDRPYVHGRHHFSTGPTSIGGAVDSQNRATAPGGWIRSGIGVGVAEVLAASPSRSAEGVVLGVGALEGIGAGFGASSGSAFRGRKRVCDAVAGSAKRAGEGGVLPARPRTTPPSQVEPANVASSPLDRKWAGSVVMGTTSSGPALGFEQAMRDAQFDEGRGVCIFGGLCLPGVPHPFSRTGVGAIGFPWQVSAQRRLSSWYGVGLSGGRAAIGTTLGQKRDLAEYLQVSYEVTTVAPMFAVSPGSWFRLAAGPVLYSANVRGGAPGGARASESHMGVGLVSEVAVDVPPRSRVFGELLFQYRRIGDVEAGPFTTSRGLSGHGSTLPVTTVSMNHWFLGFGMGMRF